MRNDNQGVMMDLISIYVANGTGILVLIMLLYVSRTRMQRDSIEDKIFTFMIIGVMLGCFMEAFSYTLDGRIFPGSRLLNYIANSYLYSVNLLLPFSVLVYVDLGLYGNIKRIAKRYKAEIAVGIFMIAMNIVNFFIPISYYITEQNVYERRPFSYVYYVIIFYYCFVAMYETHRYEKENGARTFINIKMFLIPIIIGAGLQFMFYGLSLAWLSAALGLMGLYMMQQNEMAYIDSLVDVYNRLYFNHMMSGWISNKRSIAGIMIDIDHFKSINDNFGHSEGDKALKMLTDILLKSRKNQERVFRFAGDEFIVAKTTNDPNGLEEYIQRVEKNLEEFNSKNELPYRLEISYGSSYFEPDKSDVDSFMKQMDDKMYEMKSQHHQRSD